MVIESYLAGIISFIVFVVLVIVLLRSPLPLGWFILEILLGIIVHLFSSITGFLIIQGFSYWYQASLYAFLWFCFFFVSSVYSASISVGIISYLYKQSNHTAPLNGVYQHCIVEPFEKRVEFLTTTKQIQKTEQGYIATLSGEKTVYYLRLIQKTLGMANQGFYSSIAELEGDNLGIGENQS